jgi:ribose transport system permease protein
LALLLVLIVFSLWVPALFFTWGNFRGTFDQQAIILAVAMGVMLPLIAGEFDLSVGAIAGLGAVFAVGLCENQGLSPVLAIILSVLAAATIGLANAFIIIKMKVNAFVTTLGTSTVVAGILYAYTNGQDINTAPAALTKIGQTSVIGLPITVVVVLVMAIVLLVITQKLPVGRQLIAIGANRRAAELSGIRPHRKIVFVFVTGAVVAGIAGAFYGAELGSATLSTGPTLILPGFAGAFLGATAITPGRFNILGTIVAVLLLAFVVTGLEEVGVTPAVQYLVQGGALIIAVALSESAITLRQSRLRAAQLELLTADDHPADPIITNQLDPG